ncbi:hypothetical protein [Roseimaritima ulvae]|uniref:Lactonase, 7-bladed beta-propeller n=1 Tax=Roseimaritima ulvae TaxID=980254 RepID=A0A5B9QLH0_9BACT|nr:hypothetical protein [Roseimaritima ulvae]QEG38440.1 hypothetical protein UC8_03970 [Roseimaritima ulvae]
MNGCRLLCASLLSVVGLLCVNLAQANDDGLEVGSIELASAGPLTFTPRGVLMVGDPKAATVYAVDSEESSTDAAVAYDIADLGAMLQDTLSSKQVEVVDLAVHPKTKSVYCSVTADGEPALVRITAGQCQPINLDKVRHSKIMLPNPPEDKLVGQGRRQRNPRMESITDLAFTGSRLYVSGLAADDSPSTVLEFEFPFHERSRAFRTEIFHAAHGRVEDSSAIRSFIPINIGGEPSLLAGFTCTPLVQFPVQATEKPQKLRGKTIAELGNRNRPLDMVLYEKSGTQYLLIANSARGVMKLSTDAIEQQEGLTEPVKGGASAGLEYDTIKSLEGVKQLDKLDDSRAVVLIDANDRLQLKSIELP